MVLIRAQFKDFILLFKYVYVCSYTHACSGQMTESTASPGDVVRGRIWGLGIKPGASGKAGSVCNC